MAGDIETNPGPTICDPCMKAIRDGTTLMHCRSPGCIRKCHRQQKCSGISRWTRENVGWYCRDHRQDHQPDQVPPTQQDAIDQVGQQPNTSTLPLSSQPNTSDVRCHACKKKFARTMQPLCCTQEGCEEKCHRQMRCSLIKRYADSANLFYPRRQPSGDGAPSC